MDKRTPADLLTISYFHGLTMIYNPVLQNIRSAQEAVHGNFSTWKQKGDYWKCIWMVHLRGSQVIALAEAGAGGHAAAW